MDRLATRRSRLEWQRIIDDLADLSEIEVEQVRVPVDRDHRFRWKMITQSGRT